MATSITREDCIDRIVASVQATGRDRALKDYLVYLVYAQFGCKKQMTALLAESADKDATLALMNKAVQQTHGPSFQLTVHGFKESIPDAYKDQEQLLVQHIQAFHQLLKEHLNIDAFLMSGTLLGMVREGKFLGHDDDIDLAYVSQYEAEADILKERDALLDLINAQGHMVAIVDNGVIKVRYGFDNRTFDFDLFTGYPTGEHINIYLQRPNSIPRDTILPVRQDSFYGEPVNIPNNPEQLLEVNYGPGWRVPDPTYRFNLNEHLAHYRFLLPDGAADIKLDEFDG